MPQRTVDVEASSPEFLSTANSGTLGSEEWEGWMKWDNFAETTSPKGSLDLSLPSLECSASSNSLSTNGSASPSELDTLSQINFSPVYTLSAEPAKPAAPSKKRKSSALNGATQTTTRQPRGQKISHNVIEKRYRSNLNDKIAKLRDSIPELRTATPTVKKRNPKGGNRDSDASDDDEAGLKFNKATVLTKATEYIQQLERQNQRLQSELTQVRSRGGNFDKLRNPPAITTGTSAGVPIIAPPRKAPKISPGSDGTATTAKDSVAGMIQVPEELRRFREANATTEHYGHTFPSSLPVDDSLAAVPTEPVQGLIPLADDFRRLREEGASSAHYAPEASSYYGNYVAPQDTVFEGMDVDEDESVSRWPRSKAMSRVLVGSLVGLMFMESFGENEESSADQGSGISARGLFSLPTALKTESRGFRSQIRQRIIVFLNSPHAGHAARILLFSTLFMSLAIFLFMYFAPRGSKDVREGAATKDHVLCSSVEFETENASKEVSATPVHLLNIPQQGKQRVTQLRRGLEHIVNEWCGLDWLRPRHLDEEAFKQAGSKPELEEDDEVQSDWKSLLKLLPQFLQNNT